MRVSCRRDGGSSTGGLRNSSRHPDAIAHHFGQAGDPRAYGWLLAAADRAHRAYAWLTAADRLDAALALMDEDETAAERGWLLYHLALLRVTTDTKRGNALLDDAIRAADQAGDHALAAVASCAQGFQRFWSGERRRGLAEMVAGVEALDGLSVADRDRL